MCHHIPVHHPSRFQSLVLNGASHVLRYRVPLFSRRIPPLGQSELLSQMPAWNFETRETHATPKKKGDTFFLSDFCHHVATLKSRKSAETKWLNAHSINLTFGEKFRLEFFSCCWKHSRHLILK